MRFIARILAGVGLLSLVACSAGESAPAGSTGTMVGSGDGEAPGASHGSKSGDASGETDTSVPVIDSGSGDGSSSSGSDDPSPEPGSTPDEPTTRVTEPGQAQPGVLTAGVWDDNRNFDRFLGYRSTLADAGLPGLLPITEEELKAAHDGLGAAPAAHQKLDISLIIDTTGSMGDEIAQIQQTIVSIAERIDQIQPRPELRFGLVSYRDRGDDYVTRVDDFTADVAAFQQRLLATRADGGGDEPESLNEGLHAAIQRVGWADDAVRLTFLVADAPPHLDYQQDYHYIQEARAAVAGGIKIYSIAASNSGPQAEYIFRQLAQQTLGRFIFLTYQEGQSGGAPGESTLLEAGK